MFGGVDGVITTFSTIASVAGSSLPVSAILVLGFANLIADGIAMGTGDYMSSRAELLSQLDDLKATEARFDKDPDTMRAKVEASLVDKGFSKGDAGELVGVLSSPAHKDFFVRYVMGEHEDKELPGDDMWGPAKEGMVTFLSFLAFGSIPMWVYVFTALGKYKDSRGTLGISSAATVFSLMALGWLQGFITKQNKLRASFFMTINGSLACAAAYLLSWGIMSIVGNGEEVHC